MCNGWLTVTVTFPWWPSQKIWSVLSLSKNKAATKSIRQESAPVIAHTGMKMSEFRGSDLFTSNWHILHSAHQELLLINIMRMQKLFVCVQDPNLTFGGRFGLVCPFHTIDITRFQQNMTFHQIDIFGDKLKDVDKKCTISTSDGVFGFYHVFGHHPESGSWRLTFYIVNSSNIKYLSETT